MHTIDGDARLRSGAEHLRPPSKEGRCPMERLRAVGRRLRGMFGRFVQWFRPEKGTSKRGQVSLSRIAAATMLLLFLFVGWRVWSAVQMLTPSDSLGADVASLSEGENVQNGANAAAVDAGGDRDRLNVPSPP